MSAEAEVLLERRGEAGIITLNRPKALNALNLSMVRAIHPQTIAWASDPAVTRVIIKATGEKAFCAGGDIRALHDAGKSGHVADALAFWREEYILNHHIGTYPKPYIALVDGICMGGGFGLSAHGAHRVVGDRYSFAMPEVNIGLFPDVGGTYVLPRLPGAFGVYLALTGARIKAADAHAATLATDVVPSDSFAALEEALCAGGDVERTLAEYAVTPQPGPLAQHAAFIAEAFAGHDVFAILAALDKAGEEGGPHAAFAKETAAIIRVKSPTSVFIAMEQMRRGPRLNLAESLKTEFRIVTRVAAGHDFYEGVRAVIIDKDNAPRWQPARLEEVDEAVIAAHFDPVPDELKL